MLTAQNRIELTLTVAIVAVAAIVVILNPPHSSSDPGVRALSPGAAPSSQMAAPEGTMSDSLRRPDLMMQRMRKAAQQSGGNWSRVSPEDRHLLDSLTGGHGRAMFNDMVRQDRNTTKHTTKAPDRP